MAEPRVKVNKKLTTIEAMQKEMISTFKMLGCLDVVSVSSRGGDVRFLCRVTDNEHWLKVLHAFLAFEEVTKAPWYSFFGKKYFIDGNVLRFGWVVMFDADNLDESMQVIRKELININLRLSGKSEEGKSWEVDLPMPGLFEKKVAQKSRPIK